MTDVKELLRTKIKYSRNIVFFGGAGVSTASGIKDFRSKDGLYRLQSKYGEPYEVMLSHSYFMEHTDTFYEFYKEFMINRNAKPNKAHLVLAAYEKKHHNLTIVTQNIDNLHQEAGSENVVELHGSVMRNYCMKCHDFYTLDEIMDKKGTPHCSCGGIIKPDVVLYEEGLHDQDLYRAATAIQKADIMIVGGTSLNVYPAASFVRYYRGSCLIIINKEATPYDSQADYVFHEDIGTVLEELLRD